LQRKKRQRNLHASLKSLSLKKRMKMSNSTKHASPNWKIKLSSMSGFFTFKQSRKKRVLTGKETNGSRSKIENKSKNPYC